MNTAETYDKMYFCDNYKEQFEAFRNHYRARTRRALQGRKVDHAPVSNVDCVVFLHDDPNGGVQITGTADFVEYFNHRFGDNDRIGAVRRSLANAVRKAESCPDMDRKRADAVREREEKPFTTRSAKPKFAFFQTIFAMILLLSICLWGGSTLYLNNSEAYALEVEERRAALEVSAESSDNQLLCNDSVMIDTAETTIFMSMGAADQVELYPEESVETPTMLSIFAKLFLQD
ncbi:MAG: hypothetical protein IKM08_06235 [Clostridia bacterium]|nr:hypothetical protein [Clostridia bacterium]